jgi:ArsR family transcriptional regulator, zinc-responsive transcriptional repressor
MRATAPRIPPELLNRAAEALRVLAHPHRLRICELLLHGQVSVNDLAADLRIPANAVSQHLGIMKAHGLLGSTRDGKTVYYAVVDPRPAWILGCIRRHATRLRPRA